MVRPPKKRLRKGSPTRTVTGTRVARSPINRRNRSDQKATPTIAALDPIYAHFDYYCSNICTAVDWLLNKKRVLYLGAMFARRIWLNRIHAPFQNSLLLVVLYSITVIVSTILLTQSIKNPRPLRLVTERTETPVSTGSPPLPPSTPPLLVFYIKQWAWGLKRSYSILRLIVDTVRDNSLRFGKLKCEACDTDIYICII